jgi:hypothetical protein
VKTICGLVGVAGESSADMDKVFRTLLLLDVVRGEHSTGALIVGSCGEYEVHKQVGTPHELFGSIAYQKALKYDNNVLMGHNRYATAGKINKTNAHPFIHGHIIGAHNGTLTTQSKLDDYRDYDVDSDNLYHHVELNGIQETTKLLGGAYALSWWDDNEQSINFVRNLQRPLYIAYTRYRKNLLWASEKWMLQVACEKQGVKLSNIMQLPVAKHYSLQIPLVAGPNYPDLGAFTVRGVTEYVYPKSQGLFSYRGLVRKPHGGLSKNITSYEFNVVGTHATLKHVIVVELVDNPTVCAQFNCKAGSPFYKKMLADFGILYEADVKRVSNKTSSSLIVLDKKSIKEIFVEDLGDGVDFLPATDLTVNGNMVTEQEYNCATLKGCNCCGDEAMLSDSPDLTWIDYSTFVCQFCMEDNLIREHYNLD